jgi:selenocysteine-specific elongation factor
MGAFEQSPLTLGTAGHVDHGKTALVEALTGVNTDRLAEERRRGLSIELGFAELDLPDGRSVGIVDVPGHERFIRTMVAGATGVDMFLLVVAADERVMPQTREHLDVLDALAVRHGAVALTKCDRADEEARGLAREEARALRPDAAVVEVSALTRQGLDELRWTLAAVADDAERERRSRGDSSGQPAVLHVDRSFSLRGIGTVVTGTLWSGAVGAGERVDILPIGLEARVRRVQVHNRDADAARAGQRVALNLTGISARQISRGDVVTSRDSALEPSYRLDVELRTRADVDGRRVQVHHGTRAVPARAVALGDGFAQLRLEMPVVARAGDRFVLRGISPPSTIGGGRVLDPVPRRHGARSGAAERLTAIRERGLETVVAEEQRRRARVARDRATERSRAAGEERPRPLDKKARLVLAALAADGAEPGTPRAIAERLGIAHAEAVAALDGLVEHGLAVRLSRDVYYERSALERLRARTLELARARGEITLPELRDALGTSRKYAQALLEHLDATKATVRHGDRHVLRRAPAGTG